MNEIANLKIKAPVRWIRFQIVPLRFQIDPIFDCVFKGLRFHYRFHPFHVNKSRNRNNIVVFPKTPVSL